MNLQERVTRILKQPKLEWPVIEAEPTDIATLFKSYVLPLAAIPAIAMFIGYVVFGLPFLGRLGVGVALRAAVFQYCGSLIGVVVAGFVVSKLAPTFASRDDLTQAMKLVAYSYTPVWIAGVLYLIPALSVLVILAALYSIYVFYLGVPVTMKTPAEKVIPYMVVSVVVLIVVYLVVGMIMGMAGGVGYIGSRGVL
jgi:hypothetical protein